MVKSKFFLNAFVVLFFIFALFFTFQISKAAGPVQTFNDVDLNHDHYTAIEYLANLGVLEGYGNATFLPEQEMNRAELTKTLVAGTGIDPDSKIYKNCFLDVSEEWFAPFICYAKEQGWVEGYSDGYFHPENRVTQVEAIKIIFEPLFNKEWDALNQNEINKTLELFQHVDPLEWYAKYLTFGELKNLLYQFYPAFFKSDDFVSRGLVSEYLFRSKLVSENDWVEYHPYRRDSFFLDQGIDDLMDANYPCYSWENYNDFPFYNDYLIAAYGMQAPFDYKSGGEAHLYDSGNFCDLKLDGVVFSNVISQFNELESKYYFEPHVIVFDELGQLKKDLLIDCPIAGDYIAPVLESGEMGEIFFSCVGSDLGFSFKETYLLDIKTGEYEFFKSEKTNDCRGLDDEPTQSEYDAASQQAVEELDAEGLLQGSEDKLELVIDRAAEILNLCPYEDIFAQISTQAATDACGGKNLMDSCSFTDMSGDYSGMCQTTSDSLICTP